MYNFTFSPHNLTRNEVSAPQQFRMVGVMGYNVLMFRDPSIHAARVLEFWSYCPRDARVKNADGSKLRSILSLEG